MPPAPELQARLAWRMLVTETGPPPVQVDDDRNASTPLTNRQPSSPSAVAICANASSVAQPALDQRGCTGVDGKVQLTDAYSARCHWRQKHCGECDKLRLLNSRLVGRLQAAEAHIKVLTRDQSANLEELATRLVSEGESQKLLETKLADIQPYMDLLEGITAEVTRRLEASVGPTVDTNEISTPAASIAWTGDDPYSTPVKVGTDATVSTSSPASAMVDMSPAGLEALSRSSPEESPLEGYYTNDLQRSQRSLQDALLKSLKAVSPPRQRARPLTPDWPQRRRFEASCANMASRADARKACQRLESSCGPRQKLPPGKARVEPGSLALGCHARPPVPLPPRVSSRPRQSPERRASPC